MDKDLLSIQEARDLATAACDAQRLWLHATQDEVDRVCAAMADAAFQASERLGQMAHEETGYGVAAHKKLKNEFASRNVWESIKDIKTVGVVAHDPQRKLYEIAWPMGVIVGLVPSTNPTSTVMFKVLMAVKARDAIIVCPHPSAEVLSGDNPSYGRCCRKSWRAKGVDFLHRKCLFARHAGIDAHKYAALILATGGIADGARGTFHRQTGLRRWPG